MLSQITLETENILVKIREDLEQLLELELWDGPELEGANSQQGWLNCILHYKFQPEAGDIADLRNFHNYVMETLNDNFEQGDRR
jgi:hypothetical protein